MEITLHTQSLHLTVETLGAQMTHLQLSDGTEYLWQGDAQYWPDRAPTLFPFIARLTEDSYRYQGQVYHMGIHGFAAQSEFEPIVQEPDHLVLELRDSEITRQQYPFAFCLQIGFRLKGQQVEISYHVENLDSRLMPFGIGGHPGFRVPLEDGTSFGDYSLCFAHPCQPERVGFTPALYLSGTDSPYPLTDGVKIPLHHGLFDEDAIVLRHMDREVALCCEGSERSVTVSYPDFPYLGIWHAPCTDAPYVCIEPWTSLPARQDVVEELTCKGDMIRLAPGGVWDTCWSIRLS